MVSQAIITDLPNGTELLENQVAGHTFHVGSDEIGEETALAAKRKFVLKFTNLVLI